MCAWLIFAVCSRLRHFELESRLIPPSQNPLIFTSIEALGSYISKIIFTLYARSTFEEQCLKFVCSLYQFHLYITWYEVLTLKIQILLMLSLASHFRPWGLSESAIRTRGFLWMYLWYNQYLSGLHPPLRELPPMQVREKFPWCILLPFLDHSWSHLFHVSPMEYTEKIRRH